MKPCPACTIASNNYLAYAKVFAESYREHHPGADVFVCVVDRPDPRLSYATMPFTPIFADELGIPAFASFAFRYEILELNTAVKPYFLSYLRDKLGLGKALYFDPDIQVLSNVSELGRLLDEHPVVLTPHITASLPGRGKPDDRDIVMSGVYNLGFAGFRLDETTAAFLEWWQDKLYTQCLHDIHQGLFVDQRWMDFAPAFLDNAKIVRDPVYNVAYWNLAHRRPRLVGGRWEVEGRPVGFFHFSGVDLSNLEPISRYQNRVSLQSRPELRPLFEQYAQKILAAGHERLSAVPYHYGRFERTEVKVPTPARRLIRREDPHGLRWPNPFDLRGSDSYFEWLVEPQEYPAGTLNRAVLALWDLRHDLVKAFPNPCGKDLPRYVDWLVTHGGATQAGFHPAFLAGVSERAPTIPSPGRYARATLFAATTPPAWPGAFPQLAELPLSRPGTLRGWLNEPAPGAAHRLPVITRLALMTHQQKFDLQSAYPDPLGRDQAEFAYWFVRFGAAELGLHPSLVRPVERSLRLKTRVALRARRMRERLRKLQQAPASAARTEVEGSHELGEDGDGRLPMGGEGDGAVIPEGASPGRVDVVEAMSSKLGVVLVSYRGGFGVAQVGRGSHHALRQAKIPTHHVVLDPQTLECEGSLLPNPSRTNRWSVTLIHANADETPRVVQSLPPSLTARNYRIGYWFWELSHFPLRFADSFSFVDEVWAPTRFCLESFQSIAAAPVRLVPPCVPLRAAKPLLRATLGMDPDRFYFLFCFDAGSYAERKNPRAAIEALRQLQHRTDRRVGLVLKVTGARQHADLVSHLVSATRGLPVVILTDSASREEMDGLIATCDAFLSLHRSEGLGLLPIESLYLGRPVVATDYGGTTDFIDESTGYPVGFVLRRIEQAVGPYPLGAVWAEPSVEDAVAQMLRVVSDPDDAAARVAAGQRRIADLYSVKAAGVRYATELARIEGILGNR